MIMARWLDKLRGWLQELPAASPAYNDVDRGESAPWLRGLAGRNPEIADVQEQVAAEQRGRMALVSRQGALNQWLLARLREQAPLPAPQPITHEGFFILVTLPDADAPADLEEDEYGLPPVEHWVQQEVMDAVLGADLILFLCDFAGGWQPADDRWYARLRAAGAPMLPVLAGSPGQDDGPAALGSQAAHGLDALHRHLGIAPLRLYIDCPASEPAATGSPAAVEAQLQELVSRILELRPRLAIPLAQETPAGRQLIARRVVRGGALMAALLGMEPLPLLDLPLTVLVQWKMALQLAAIHGRPGVEVLSREMAGTVGLNLLVRTTAQQALKFLPILGWLFSASLNFASTWLLGQALLRVYAGEQRLSWRGQIERLSDQLRARARRAAEPLKLARWQRKGG